MASQSTLLVAMQPKALPNWLMQSTRSCKCFQQSANRTIVTHSTCLVLKQPVKHDVCHTIDPSTLREKTRCCSHRGWHRSFRRNETDEHRHECPRHDPIRQRAQLAGVLNSCKEGIGCWQQICPKPRECVAL